MNKFIVSGRLTADAEISQTAAGKRVAKFNIAVNRRFAKEGEIDADFFSCVAFGKTAEIIEKCYVTKGTKLLIDGEVRNNNYTDKDGVKRYGTQILVNSFEFCESKNSEKNTASATIADIPEAEDLSLGEMGDFEEILSDCDCPF